MLFVLSSSRFLPPGTPPFTGRGTVIRAAVSSGSSTRREHSAGAAGRVPPIPIITNPPRLTDLSESLNSLCRLSCSASTETSSQREQPREQYRATHSPLSTLMPERAPPPPPHGSVRRSEVFAHQFRLFVLPTSRCPPDRLSRKAKPDHSHSSTSQLNLSRF